MSNAPTAQLGVELKRKLLMALVLVSFLAVALSAVSVQAQAAVHDVEAVSQTVIENEVLPGDVVSIDVTVRNNGDYTESFDVSCWYDSVLLGTIRVNDLASGASTVVTFTWDTTGVPMNGYSIVAWADSGMEIDEASEVNNECKMPAKIFVVPELPVGTILAVLSMFAALVGYTRFKRPRTK